MSYVDIEHGSSEKKDRAEGIRRARGSKQKSRRIPTLGSIRGLSTQEYKVRYQAKNPVYKKPFSFGRDLAPRTTEPPKKALGVGHVKVAKVLHGFVQRAPTESPINEAPGEFASLRAFIEEKLKGLLQRREERAEIRFGRITYPLSRPLDGSLRRALSERLFGVQQGAGPIEAKIHVEYQRLSRIAPHEMSREDSSLWLFLNQVVDRGEFVRRNPSPEQRTGRISEIDLHRVVLDWFGFRSEAFALDEVPAEVAAANVGDTVYALLDRSGGSERWLSCRVGPALRQTHEVPAAEIDSIESVAAAPRGSWPRKGA